MKITRSQLKQIIKEELKKVLKEEEREAIYPQPLESLEDYEKAIKEYKLKHVKVVPELKSDARPARPNYGYHRTEDIASFKAHIKFVFGDKGLRLEDKDLEFPIRDVLEDFYIYAEQLRPGKEIKSNYITMIIEPELADIHHGLDGLHTFMREMREIDRDYNMAHDELLAMLETEGVFQREIPGIK